ncbi:MAG: helix-turn-helix transcriptional regulator [Acidobacteriaceae bacterium]|nr:helix-turn-helix transcriptional regulator [Acidobacteriaceae bacterium]
MQAKRLKSAAARSAPVFAALGDQRRLRLLARLCSGGPGSITTLSSDGDVTRQAVTKHLRVLARAGLVRAVHQGRETIYRADTQQLHQAHQYFDIISRQWEEALARLKNLVEDP